MEYDIYISSVNNILKKYKKRSTLVKKIHDETIDFYVNSLKYNEKHNNISDLNKNIPIPEYNNYKIKKNKVDNKSINTKNIGTRDVCCALEWSPKGEQNRCSRNKENDNDFCSLHLNYRPYGVCK
jgi:hypothetical protein